MVCDCEFLVGDVVSGGIGVGLIEDVKFDLEGNCFIDLFMLICELFL